MTLRRIQFVVFAVVLLTFLLASSVARPTARHAARGKSVTSAAPAKAASGSLVSQWVFEGCWTQFSAGPCRDVFRDQQGAYWICGACGTTNNPGPGKCNMISPTTLARGFWCS